MTPILTITLNPTVDLATRADHVRPGSKLRCDAPEIDPGGGGVNVSRAITILGGHSTAFVAIGGATGDHLTRLLAREGIGLVLFNGPGETRQSFAVIDRETGKQFRFLMPGPVWAPADVSRGLSRIARAAQKGAIVVLSGSQPPGVPVDFAARLSARLASKGARLFLDTSGAALHRFRDAGAPPVALLRIDDEEAEDLAGHALPHRHDSADFAQSLVRRGLAHSVIIARGAEGSVYADAGRKLFVAGADVPVVSKVGAGDSFLASYTLATAQGDAPPRALSRASAAAASAVMTEATKLCVRRDVERLIRLCPVEQL